MIVIPRGLARTFRVVARKCNIGRSRRSAPPITVRTDGKRLLLVTHLNQVSLAVEVPQTDAAERTMVVPTAVFDAVDGAEVTLTATGLKGTARWEENSGPRTIPFEAFKFDKHHEPRAIPEEVMSLPPAFLSALHECGRTASREVGRYAMERVQVNGAAGTVTATDSKQALVWDGFRFPFTEIVLVPAIPLFGIKDLAAAIDIRVGCTKDHLVIRAGAWTVWLAIDAIGRFPDVGSVIPKSPNPTLAGIDEQDAADLLAALPLLPGASHDLSAVTLDIDRGVTVRARNDETDEIREVRLARSTFAGPSVRIAVDRRYLARALSLGCLSLCLVPGRPLVAEGPGRKFVVMTLEASGIVPPQTTKALASCTSPIPLSEPERRINTMKSHETNGHDPIARPDPSTNGVESLDPLTEAEGLRAALTEAATRAGRLVQCLRQFKRQRRVLESAWSSLKSLGIGPGGGGS